MTTTDNTSAKGIGGWLILVVLGLIVGPIRIAHFLYTVHWPIFRDGSWEILTTPGGELYHPLWAPLITFEIISNLVSILLALITLWHLTKKSHHTPKFAIYWLLWTAATVSIDYFAADLIPSVAAESDTDSVKELVKSIFSAVVWVPYFLLSKRVKATFIE